MKDSGKRQSFFRISHATIRELLVPVYIDTVPEKDPWDHPYQFAVNAEPNDHTISIRSAARDGRFESDDYLVGGFRADEFDHDIVWSDGYFMRWPELDVPPAEP